MLNKYDGYTVGPNLRQLRKDKKSDQGGDGNF